ncbi:hypothetical protein A4G99_18595 [Haladaptatus sp. R4]|uniref:DUF502 domain-containing protein n=1 Tax=Haladaptatus sp. R4 TaxID=1679489 RepID=UPI0007B484EF|nr:DUF502 domain-containing protein [Haladaptatus sp. R4]KZN22738.1 hypothetical protein A4G99_18595 [Haladaptatus sp. R4]
MATSDDLSLLDKLRETALTGITVVVPLLITLYVVVVLLKFVRNMLIPLLGLVPVGSIFVLGGIAVLVIVSMILMVGFVAHSPVGERAIDNFDYAISQIPGLGTVYRSFRRMGDAMIESDEDHFRDVKLLEFPTDDTYTFAFVTAETPDEVRKATGEEKMTTVFLPMAPNPVMGGFVVNVPNDDLLDVDIPLEVAFRALVTSGVGLDEMGASTEGLSEDQLRRLTGQDVARYQD